MCSVDPFKPNFRYQSVGQMSSHSWHISLVSLGGTSAKMGERTEAVIPTTFQKMSCKAERTSLEYVTCCQTNCGNK